MNVVIVIDVLAWALSSMLKKEKQIITVPITIVDHKEDDSWAFFSGTYLTKIRLSTLGEAIENDSTVAEINDLPLGFSAKRKMTDLKWTYYKSPEINDY